MINYLYIAALANATSTSQVFITQTRVIMQLYMHDERVITYLYGAAAAMLRLTGGQNSLWKK